MKYKSTSRRLFRSPLFLSIFHICYTHHEFCHEYCLRISLYTHTHTIDSSDTIDLHTPRQYLDPALRISIRHHIYRINAAKTPPPPTPLISLQDTGNSHADTTHALGLVDSSSNHPQTRPFYPVECNQPSKAEVIYTHPAHRGSSNTPHHLLHHGRVSNPQL